MSRASAKSHFQIEPQARIVCLSNVFDQSYLDLRGELIFPALSSAKRRDLFRCLELASGREVLLLSSPSKALKRKGARWLPAVETHFSTHRQWFCANWDAPKIRIPLSWMFYAAHVLRHVQDGDVVILDNYELLYVIAARLVRLFRKVTILLDYEDGKHHIDKGWNRLMSGLAEILGKPLVQGALVAHPALRERLPERLPSELVPGFVLPAKMASRRVESPVRFLYTGSLDKPRGVEMLFAALHELPEEGWRLDMTGGGPLRVQAQQFAADPKWKGKVAFHGLLPLEALQELVAKAHVGLNCQLSSDPISSVTFPSKVFSYLSAGLMVLSSRASEVPAICGGACLYFDEETPASLAQKMKSIIQDPAGAWQPLNTEDAFQRYSIEGTATRLKQFLETVVPDLQNKRPHPSPLSCPPPPLPLP